VLPLLSEKKRGSEQCRQAMRGRHLGELGGRQARLLLTKSWMH
jgi:hypothetical protein